FATSLVRDRNGNLFGITMLGGDLSGCGGRGCGVIFKIAACHSAICHGKDDADIASGTIDPATAMQHTSTVASSNPALGGPRNVRSAPRATFSRLSLSRPRNRTNELVPSPNKGCIRVCA